MTIKKISQEEVSAAIQQFLKEGGLIEHLPNQGSPEGKVVGESKYDIYESFNDLTQQQ